MTWKYNQREEPPAPFLELTLRHPEFSAQSVVIPAKVDSGADISALPQQSIDQLHLPMTSRLFVQGYDGISHEVATYAVHIELAGARFRVSEAISTHESFALLGRDILNHFYVKLNGPDLTLDINLRPF